ncbi:TOBE domain-containing protein [Methylocystis sp. H4A]|uniref:TOBE domain-containing protein n=1 Tax=Methylocystis sp. H4A TaxID=2785788 RepID=UPI001FEE8568|nr:TOBE domain-containing protein [Methylocystis sp. H4A]
MIHRLPHRQGSESHRDSQDQRLFQQPASAHQGVLRQSGGRRDAAPSHRNCFRGVVTQRIDAERNSEILLDVGFEKTMTAVTPRHDVEDMGLKKGDVALATFDASNVILAVE